MPADEEDVRLARGSGYRHEDIPAEQAYLDWAVGQLEAELLRLERGPLMGDGAVDRQILALRRQKAAELQSARHALLVGRLDIESGSKVAGTWYIGRTDVADETYEPVIVDWRSDLGERFYAAGRLDPQEVGRRRTFGTDGNTITSIDDEVLIPGFQLPGAEPRIQPVPEPGSKERRRRRAKPRPQPGEGGAEAVGADAGRRAPGPPGPPEPVDSEQELIGDLRAKDLLLAELERERTAEMHEIVATIQADQDRFIRTDPSEPLVVQGGPGTGKTVVGLHRAAYLLYKQRQGALDQSMLIVGPNSAFMAYIGAVLPSLGETAGRQMSVDEVMTSALKPADLRRLQVLSGSDGHAVAQVKGSPAMVAVLARAVWAHAKPIAVEASFRGMRARLDEHEVRELLDRAAHGRPYEEVRGPIERQLAEALARKVRIQDEEMGRTRLSSDLEDFARMAQRQLRTAKVRESIMPTVTVADVLDRVLGEPAFLDAIASDLLTASERAALTAEAPRSAAGKARRRSSADLALLDEIAAVLGAEVTRFDHVIVDEAQDLSPMQWRALMRRVRAGGITILGDLAQATGAWSPESWRDLLDHLGFEGRGMVGELRLGYRVPRPILEYASRLLSVAAPGVVEPVSYRDGEDPRLVQVAVEELWDTALGLTGVVEGRTAVIVAPDAEIPLAAQSADGTTITVLSPDESKGLEFDHVILIEPATLASQDRRGFRQTYVALTRATKRLDIVHSRPLPPLLEGQIPGLGAPEMAEPQGSVPAWGLPHSLEGVSLVLGPRMASAAPGANWFPDPTARFSHRFWDGERWTGWVAAASGAVAADPVPVADVAGPDAAPAQIDVVGLPTGSSPPASGAR